MTNEEIVKSYKGRRPGEGQRVRVYRNLGNAVPEKFSILDPKTGLVIGHADEIVLNDVLFTVSDAGRERVLEEGQKNVHAFATGHIDFAATRLILDCDPDSGDRCCDRIRYLTSAGVSYNPYSAGHFVGTYTGEKVERAQAVFFADDGKGYVGSLKNKN